jgi:uncharacterized protein YbaR (Trm112 family)
MLGGGARRETSSPAPSGGGIIQFQQPAVPACVGCQQAARIALVISPELLEVLACPKCKQKLDLDEEGSALVCQTDRLRYPIVDGIPVMLIDEATSF